MLGKLRSLVSSNDEEEGCRQFYLDADIKQARLAMLLFFIPLLGFIVNDYMFFKWTAEFFGLLSVRLALLAVTSFGLVHLSKVKSYRPYDTIIFSSAFILMIGVGIINLTRPVNYTVEVIVTLLSIFILYLAIPLRFLYQNIICWVGSIGEAAIILIFVKPTQSTVLFTLIFSLLVSNVIGILVSRQLHRYREESYREFVKRQEMQDRLKQHNQTLEETVAERTEKLKKAERFAAIGETAGMLGHDLRNPLTGIVNATYYLKKKYAPVMDDTGREMLRVIDENAVYSNQIISDLLDYSRDVKLDLTPVDLKLILSEALNMVTLPSNIELVNLTDDSLEINADAGKMKRVFSNIIKNAVDAMPNGGKLTLKSGRINDNIRIEFADTGSGISEENQTKLFQPLFTTKNSGIGFGLTICKRIVEAHKGEITVQSKLNSGTRFIIDLPALTGVPNDSPPT